MAELSTPRRFSVPVVVQRLRPAPTAALLVLFVLALFATLGPALTSADESLVDFASAGTAPSGAHPFGTDGTGRDLLAMVAVAMRVSLGIALVTAAVSTVVGVVVGLIAGLLGGWWDRIVMRIADAFTALPSLLLSILIVAMFSGSVPAIIVSLVLTHWTAVARVVRTEVLPLRDAEFVQAARLAGVPSHRIARIHLLPVVAGQAAVGAVFLVAHAIWHESTLSFLGLGLPAHRASLGTLLSDAQEALLLGQWWRLLFPAGAIIAATLALAVLGRAGASGTARGDRGGAAAGSHA
ncbi:ABC transporter permease [Tsukamurella sp. 8F]|uniref:ABC transporter permease n=1 Tax=unclassified Tsukamurella TaxID=2633480 RepID=UPI0023B8BCB7|nr:MULTISPECIES: ABC transporter permease [unclassified Tsukamurella]MDF0531941.1 ABC transporter permease [Tsukamurella sp. 8J]MDF0588008.1 ABC transporter permease [Tsukamurella sp. 8F]